MKRMAIIACLLFAGSGCSEVPSEPVPLPELVPRGAPVALADDPERQFDFWLGDWDVENRHLQKDGSWPQSGTARARIQPVANGTAVLEQWTGEANDEPLIGFSLRAYDSSLDKWVIFLNWPSGNPSELFRMLGTRRGERIEQFPPDDDKHLRYSFAEAHEDSCQWEGARSNNGDVWITDWVMQFRRREAPLEIDATNAPIRRPAKSSLTGQARALDFLIGAWEGAAKTAQTGDSPQEGPVRVRVTSMLEGLGLLQFVDTAWDQASVTAMAYTGSKGWEAVMADDQRDGLTYMTASDAVSDGSVVFTPLGAADVRESWNCEDADRCSWRREVAGEDGEWSVDLEAALSRSISTAPWIGIRNARAPFPDILTGGQVTERELEWAARNGYRTVINTRSEGEEGMLEGEAETVEQLGMEYFVIPVASADDLSADTARRLADVLAAEDRLPAIVHCGSGNRVGALFALKARELDGVPAEQALQIGLQAGMTSLEPVVRRKLGLPESTER